MNKIYFLVLISFLLVNCSVVPKAEKSLSSKAKNLSPTEDKALVYIVNSSLSTGVVVFNVAVNGNHIGSAGSKRFLYTYLESGTYTFSSKSENRSEVLLVVEAGKTYFLEQKPQMGILISGNKLFRIDEKKGRHKLQKCSLSKTNVYGQF